MTTEVQVVATKDLARPAQGGAGWLQPGELDAAMQASAWLARSGQLPALRTPEAVFYAMMMLRDLGMSPMLGLPFAYQDPKGRIDFEVKVKLAAVQGRCPGFEYREVHADSERCVIEARLHSTHPWTKAEFTIEQARKAGLVKDKSAWDNYPIDQLRWKAILRWLRLHAGPILFGMGLPAIVTAEEQHLAVDLGEVVVEDGSSTRPAVHHPDASGSSIPGVPAPVSGSAGPSEGSAGREEDPEKKDRWYWRTQFAKACKKMGRTRNEQFFDLLAVLFKDMGLTPPSAYSAVGPTDWKKAYEALAKRYDPETGRERPAAGTAGATPQAEAAGVEDAPDTGEPTPPSPPPVGDAEPEDPNAGEYPTRATLEQLERGDAAVLIEFCMWLEDQHRAAGKQIALVQEYPADSGEFFFVHDTILKATGCVDPKTKGARTALLQTKQEKYAGHVAGEQLRIMFARGALEMLRVLRG